MTDQACTDRVQCLNLSACCLVGCLLPPYVVPSMAAPHAPLRRVTHARAEYSATGTAYGYRFDHHGCTSSRHAHQSAGNDHVIKRCCVTLRPLVCLAGCSRVAYVVPCVAAKNAREFHISYQAMLRFCTAACEKCSRHDTMLYWRGGLRHEMSHSDVSCPPGRLPVTSRKCGVRFLSRWTRVDHACA